MKHINENFENSSIKNLSNGEIELFQSTISSLKESGVVEGIILLPFIKNMEEYKEPLEYNIAFIIFVDKSNVNNAMVKTCIQNFNYSINNCEDRKSDIISNIYNINIFDNDDIDFSRFALETFLVSSYILYDKNGTLGELQDKLSLKARPINNKDQSVIKIGNIDMLEDGMILGKKA